MCIGALSQVLDGLVDIDAVVRLGLREVCRKLDGIKDIREDLIPETEYFPLVDYSLVGENLP